MDDARPLHLHNAAAGQAAGQRHHLQQHNAQPTQVCRKRKVAGNEGAFLPSLMQYTELSLTHAQAARALGESHCMIDGMMVHARNLASSPAGILCTQAYTRLFQGHARGRRGVRRG
jgi:hypothetical protein